MPSPFPGMDPWLERPGVFPDVHDALIFLLREALNATLPPGYFATGANRVWIDDTRQREPDVAVTGPTPWTDPGGGVAVAAYTQLGMLAVAAPFLAEPSEEPYVEVRSTDDDRLVTAIEVLSPSNKTAGNPARTAYRQKQGEFRSRGVNAVEIDLLRGGTHTTAIPLAKLRARVGAFDYHVCVTADAIPGHFFIAAVRLADRLPTVGIPLDGDVGPVPIDLQALFDRAYDTGRCRERAKYGRVDPQPPLSPEQHAWAAGLLRAQGLVK